MSHLYVNFLDVGQGDGTIITFPNGEKMLVDLGSVKNSQSAGEDALTYLKNEVKSKYIKYLFLTHPDRDHYNLIPDLSSFRYKQSYYGGYYNQYAPLLMLNIKLKCNNNCRGFPPFTEISHLFTEDKVEVWLLSANYNYYDKNSRNNHSLVLMLVYNKVKIILMGDAEEPVELEIIKNDTNNLCQNISVLKMGHHGSNNGTSEAWIKYTQPRFVFVSADSKWEHPYYEAVNRAISSPRIINNVRDHGWIRSNPKTDKKPYYVAEGKYREIAMYSNIYHIEYDKYNNFTAYGTQNQLQTDGKNLIVSRNEGSGMFAEYSSGWFIAD